MPADIICIHQGEGGTVCGDSFRVHENVDQLARAIGVRITDKHTFVPGRKCPTCWGSGKVEDGWAPSIEYVPDCPTCAGSPVRGYLEVTR